MSFSKYIKINKNNHENLYICPGNPLLGNIFISSGRNFCVPSKYGEKLTLLLYIKDENTPVYEIVFPEEFKIGNMFTLFIGGIDWSLYEYVFKMKGINDPKRGFYFCEKELLDPYANYISGMGKWGETKDNLRSKSIPSKPMDNFVNNPNLKIEELIIYEMHLRGFTQNDLSLSSRGTYLGLEKKIPYLLDLGVNCVELLPIFEFNEFDNSNVNPKTNEKLKNYWGYSTLSYFAPKSSYSNGDPISELQHLINELHKNNIEVILDVVFNHTAENELLSKGLSFKGLDCKTYYLMDDYGNLMNYSGCGNTFNCNNPTVKNFILDSLRYWKYEFKVDGFRFDLASVLTRDEKGKVINNAPVLEEISKDSVLSGLKFIAEPWDAGGLYQLGYFDKTYNWLEWNGTFRDDVRRFLIGENDTVENLIKRIEGSKEIFKNNSSVNFICCHDGFTLNDLFSYNEKHNEANGENNKDGNNFNFSFNCGFEGETDKQEILNLRTKQIKNALLILFMSRGIPMILMGDECGRTQKGNNNAYCQDNEISWFDWSLPEKNKDIFDFTKRLIKFRKNHKSLFWNGNFEFHGIKIKNPDLKSSSHTLAFTIKTEKEELYVGLNMFTEPLTFDLPRGNWETIFSTDKNLALSSIVLINSKSTIVLYRQL